MLDRSVARVCSSSTRPMKRLDHLLVLSSVTLLAACGDGLQIPRVPTRVVYEGEPGEAPLPNDVYFADRAMAANLDATLNLPLANDAGQQALFDSLNSLDGWSTVAPFTIRFSRGIDAATAVAGESVRLFEVDAFADPVSGLKIGMPLSDVLTELSAGVDYEVALAAGDSTGVTLEVRPLVPLAPKTIHLVVITAGVRDAEGFAVAPGPSYELAKATNIYPPEHPLSDLQIMVAAMEILASQDPDVVPPIPREDIVAAVTFTTQSTGDVLAAVRMVSQGDEATVLADLCAAAPAAGHVACTALPLNTVPTAAVPGPLIGTTAGYGGLGRADIYQTSLTLPYYSSAAPNPGGVLVQSTEPLTGRWTARFSYLEGVVGLDPLEVERNVTQHNPLPLESGVEAIPVLITLPNGTSMAGPQPGAGWPVVIFQHGLLGDRTDVLALADSLADAGFATVAIDLPLHGVDATEVDLFMGYQDSAPRERTFGLDLLDPITEVDPSGAHFINFDNLQTQRDNLRQAVSDLFAVVKLIQDNLDVDGMGQPLDFDPTKIHFLGYSMGGALGASFAAVDATSPLPAVQSVTLFAPGGGIARLLEQSPTYGPSLQASLAAAGVSPGTPEYEFHLLTAQSAMDSADPINFCESLGGNPVQLFVQQIVGGGAISGQPDDVILGSVPDAPLSGTNPMVALLGLATVTVSTDTEAGHVRFCEGTHQSLFDADPAMDLDLGNQAAFDEIRMQLTEWLTSLGTLTARITITDPSVIVH